MSLKVAGRSPEDENEVNIDIAEGSGNESVEPEETAEQTRVERHWRGWEVIREKLPIALLVFFTFTACILVAFMLFMNDAMSQIATKLLTALRPVFIGLVWGYLLNPVMDRIEYFLDRRFFPRTLEYEKTKGRIRMLSAVITVLISVFFIAALVVMIVPAIMESSKNFVENFYINLDSLLNWLRSFDFIRDNVPKDVDATIEQGGTFLMEWLKTNVFDQIKENAAALTGSVVGVVRMVLDFLIGIIVAIYVLNEKNRFEGQAKKITYAVFPVKTANLVVDILHKCNEIFSGFIVGKIVDSIIIGILCFIVCSVVGMPYAAIVSVVVGVTNVIPFFGPFIGAIPCFILIVFTDPLYGLYFLIFILVLQQIDGNIIGPKILGDSTGLSSFWVITSILVGGSLFGFAGMLFGVPVFATIYYILRRFTDYLSDNGDRRKSSLEFTIVKKVDETTGEFVYDENRKEKEEALMEVVGEKKRFRR